MENIERRGLSQQEGVKQEIVSHVVPAEEIVTEYRDTT
jgi:hypothetical protein